MNAAIKYVAIPVIAVTLLAVGSTAFATSAEQKEPLASQLMTALEDNDNVAGTFGKGGTTRVAVWFKAEPSAEEISMVCTKAGEIGLTDIHKMVVGVNNPETVTCP